MKKICIVWGQELHSKDAIKEWEETVECTLEKKFTKNTPLLNTFHDEKSFLLTSTRSRPDEQQMQLQGLNYEENFWSGNHSVDFKGKIQENFLGVDQLEFEIME